jgi:methyl-accepting chemotaxis protein
MGSLKRNRELGQAGIALIIVIAWALTAVVMLTRTLISAQAIDKKVDSITNSLGEVHDETALVAELQKTEKTSAAILTAAKPLTGMLGHVDEVAKNIDVTAKSINPNAKAINATVVSINGHVVNILSTARAIEQTLVTATNQATSIKNSVNSIKGDSAEIQRQTSSDEGIRFHTCGLIFTQCTRGAAGSFEYPF